MKLGRTEPRLWTRPLRELTVETSYGYDLIDFAATIGWPLDPWEKWAAIHMGELLPNGTPRFRFCLILVARQNGKTLLIRVLILYWMFIEAQKNIFGVSTGRDTAKFSWTETMKMAEDNEMLSEELAPIHTRSTISEEVFWNELGSNYRFAANNSRAGRSYTVNRAVIDEIREHKNRDVYDALINAGNAVADFQAVAISNQGDATAIVLDEIRTSALEYIETGVGDPRLFIAEWSSPSGSDPTDLDALAYANPNLNIRVVQDALIGMAIQAKKAGGETLARFKTEVMCQKITLLDPAIEPELWKECGTDNRINFSEHRRSVVLCLDVSPQTDHATLMACVKVDDLFHVEVVQTWSGFGCTKQVKAELPLLIEKVRPRALGWFPGGPAAAIASDLRSRSSMNAAWPPRNVKIVELNQEESTSICMGLAETVHGKQLIHPKDAMLTEQINSTQKLKRGDRWIYTRGGVSAVDASYATAGVVHLAKTLPAPLKPVSSGRDL